MAVKIRLQRHGKKNFAFFHIVVADTRSPRDGRYIEQNGTYNPNSNPASIVLDNDKALAWLNVGAELTLVTRRILSYEGADKKFAEWKARRDAKIEAKKSGLSKAAADKAKAAAEAEAKVNKERAEALNKKREEVEEAAKKAAEEAAAAKVAEDATVSPAEEAPAETQEA